jgi:hypothetical protein
LVLLGRPSGLRVITGNRILNQGNQSDGEKQFRETALPTGRIEPETAQGRADVGDVTTAQTLGTLARTVLSISRYAESRELARAVLRLLARSKKQS